MTQILSKLDYQVLEVFLFFLTVWVAWSFLYSYISGWHKLATVYRLKDLFESDYSQGQPARVCNWPYKHVNIGANSLGIYFGFSYLYRLSHRPLFIPWSDVATELKKGLIMNSVDMRFRLVPTVTIRLYEDLYRNILNRAGPFLDLSGRT
jgi:hypothetical protein